MSGDLLSAEARSPRAQPMNSVIFKPLTSGRPKNLEMQQLVDKTQVPFPVPNSPGKQHYCSISGLVSDLYVELCQVKYAVYGAMLTLLVAVQARQVEWYYDND